MAASRYNAEVGQTVRLKARFDQNQTTLIDPYEITQVEILDPTDAVVQTIPGASAVRESLGVWYVDYAIAAGATTGLWRDRWTWRPYSGYDLRVGSSSFQVFPAGTFSAAEGYLTVAQIHDLGFIDSSSPLTDAQIDYLSRLATTFIERALGQVFRSFAGAVDVDGTGRPFLHMPSSHWVRSLTNIVNLDTGESIDVTPLRFRGAEIFHRDWRPWPHRYESPPYLGCVTQDVFPRGHKNIRVTGTFGQFESPPVDLQHAVGVMVKYAGMDDTVTAPWILNYTSEGVDGQQVSYRDMDPDSRKKALTGIAEVDAILNNYYNRRPRIRSLVR
jgi:hypothetical protein